MARGFSLVETIVAIGILTSGVVTLAHVISIGVETAANARYRTAITTLAQQKLEQLRAESELTDGSAGVEHRDETGSKVCETEEPCGAAFVTARWSITPVASHAGLVMVRVAASHARRHYGVVRSFGVRPRRIR
jgi:Tfp pilus assembly protein PilV